MSLLPRALNPATDPARVRVIGGAIYPRVTTVISETLAKPGLVSWWRKNGFEKCDELSKEAVVFGSRAHGWFEKVNRDPDRALPSHCPPDLEPAVRAYMDLCNERVERVVACEKPLISRKHGFCGTADVIFELRSGEFCVADFKTGDFRRPWPEHHLQTAAYSVALAEQEGIVARERIIFMVSKARPGVVVPFELDNHREDVGAFLALLRIWRWKEAFR